MLPSKKPTPKNDMDDIDSLLAGMNTNPKKSNDLDDIDSLLADLGGTNKKSNNSRPSANKGSSEIDDLLAGLL